MLSEKNFSIEDLPVPVKALTESEASTVEGGVNPMAIRAAIVAGTVLVASTIDSVVNGENSETSRVLADWAYELFNDTEFGS